MHKKSVPGSMSLLRHNISYLFLWQLASYVLPMLTMPYLARVLGPSGYGMLGVTQAVVGYGLLLTDWGFSLSATQEIAKRQQDRAHISRVFWNTLLAKLLLALLSLLILAVTLLITPETRASATLLLISWLSVLGSAFTVNWLLQGMERMGALVIAALAGRLITVPLIFLLVHGPDDAVWAVLIQGIGVAVTALITLWVVAFDRIVDWVAPSLSEAWILLRGSYTLFVASAAINAYTATNTIILGIMRGSAEVGLFTGADKVRVAAQGLLNPVSQAAFPRVNALMNDVQEEAFALLRKMLLIQGVFALFLCICLFSGAPFLVRLILGGDYGDAVSILRWLSIQPFLIGLSNIFGIQVMLPLGKRNAFRNILLASALLNMCLIFPLTHHLGAVGVAVTMGANEFFVSVAMALYIHRQRIPLFTFRNRR